MTLHLMEACMILAAARKLVAIGGQDHKVQIPENRTVQTNPVDEGKTPLRESAGRALTLAG